MAYNYSFPYGYPYGYNAQPNVPNTPYNNGQNVGQTIPQSVQNNAYNGITWVQGEAGARGYPVAPGQTVQLWDSDAQVIYLKSADASGMPSMKVLDYEIRETASPANALKKNDYITREEFEKVIKELKETTNE